MFQRALVSILVLAVTYVTISPLVEMVAQSMDTSANMIAAATHGH